MLNIPLALAMQITKARIALHEAEQATESIDQHVAAIRQWRQHALHGPDGMANLVVDIELKEVLGLPLFRLVVTEEPKIQLPAQA